MRRVWAFAKRDFRIAKSYRMSFVFAAVGGLITVTVFYFLSKTMGEVPLLRERYGAGYFAFALVGVTAATCLRGLQGSFAQRIREAQTDGSLEVLLMSPSSTFGVVGSLAAWPLLSALFRSVALLVVGVFVFGARLEMNVPGFLGSLLVSLVPFAALGLLSAAFVLIFKRGDPFSYALDAASYLLSGIVYPVEVLPSWLQWVARALPTTHAVEALRASALRGTEITQLLPLWGILALFAAVLWPFSALALVLARRHVERTGTLPHS